MVKTVNIAICGSTNLDLIWTIDAFPRSHTKIRATAHYARVGGSGAITSIYSARNCQTYLISQVGTDPAGVDCINALRASRVNTDYVRTTGVTNKAAILLAGADKRIITSPKRPTPRKIEPRILDLISNCSLLHIAEKADAFNSALAEHAYNMGIPVTVEMKANKNKQLLRFASGVFLNSIEYQMLTNSDISKSATRALGLPSNAFAVITNDGGPIFLAQHDCLDTVQIPTLEAPIRNRNGAGDSFNGGFISHYVNSSDLVASILAGQQSAALRLTSAI